MMKWIAGLAMLTLACRSNVTQTECLESGAPRPPAVAAVANPAGLCVPEGTLLLIRDARTLAALRFHDVRDVDPEKPTGCARYELHAKSDGAWRTTAGTVASLGSFGVHPFVGEHGRSTIAGPGVKLSFVYPTCIWMQRDVEYAPTGWTMLDDVDPSDPRLQWFRIDESLSRFVTIPLADLPGGP